MKYIILLLTSLLIFVSFTPVVAFEGGTSKTEITKLTTRKEKRALRKQLKQKLKTIKKNQTNKQPDPNSPHYRRNNGLAILVYIIFGMAIAGLVLLILGLMSSFPIWMAIVGGVLLLPFAFILFGLIGIAIKERIQRRKRKRAKKKQSKTK